MVFFFPFILVPFIGVIRVIRGDFSSLGVLGVLAVCSAEMTMLSGTALALSELPLELMTQHGLERRICERGGEREVQFLFADSQRLLPVWRHGRLEILRWGNRRGESAQLPCTAWTQLDTLESGGWGEHGVESVVIPATMGLDKGVWYRIRQGIRGLVVHDERGCPRIYVICEPSSHYYQVMTRGSRWMPALIGERI